MITNWAMSKDDLYGPPPAYSINNHVEHPGNEGPAPEPPCYTPSVYVLPISDARRRSRFEPSHPLIFMPKLFGRYLIAAALIHLTLGLASLVCDIILTIMNESYSFTGLWTGACNILLGIYIFLFINCPEKHVCALERLRFFNVVMSLITVVALVLTSINLASDTCYKPFMGPDRCQSSAYIIKIVLLVLLSLIILTLFITIGWIVRDGSKMKRNDYETSESIDR